MIFGDINTFVLGVCCCMLFEWHSSDCETVWTFLLVFRHLPDDHLFAVGVTHVEVISALCSGGARKEDTGGSAGSLVLIFSAAAVVKQKYRHTAFQSFVFQDAPLLWPC